MLSERELYNIGQQIYEFMDDIVSKMPNISEDEVGAVLDEAKALLKDLQSERTEKDVLFLTVKARMPALIYYHFTTGWWVAYHSVQVERRLESAIESYLRQLKEVPANLDAFFAEISARIKPTIEEWLIRSRLRFMGGELARTVKKELSGKVGDERAQQIADALSYAFTEVLTTTEEINWSDPDAVLGHIAWHVGADFWNEIKSALGDTFLANEISEYIRQAKAVADAAVKETIEETWASVSHSAELNKQAVEEVAGHIGKIVGYLTDALDCYQRGEYERAGKNLTQAFQTAVEMENITTSYSYEKLFKQLGFNFRHLFNEISHIYENLDIRAATARPAADVRAKLASQILTALSETKFLGKYKIEDILEETKGEIRRALGGNSAAFVVHTHSTPTAFIGYLDDLVFKWLFGAHNPIDHFVDKIYGEVLRYMSPSGIYDFFNLVTATVQKTLKEDFYLLVSGKAFAGKLDRKEVDTWLYEALAHAVEEIFRMFPPPKAISVEDAVAYFKGRRELANNVASTLTRARQQAIAKPSFLVFYITTEPEGYLYLGTEMDAHSTSCFWTHAGEHSIPSLLVGRNVAVCYVFHFQDEESLKRAGGAIPSAYGAFLMFTPTNAELLWQHGTVIGRTLIVVDEHGRVTKTDRGNTYTDRLPPGITSHTLWGILRFILQKEFADVRLSETEWYYIEPSR